jgi:3',5'-cyclic-AMP phosphodiesterase
MAHGELDAATLDWLETTLASSLDRPALLFLHHPPFWTGITHMDRMYLHNAADLASIVSKHSRVRMIGSGHVHRATLTMFAGVPATICPTPNHAVDLDLGELREPSLIMEPPAFHLHAWFSGGDFGTVVTHHVPIGQLNGRTRFLVPPASCLSDPRDHGSKCVSLWRLPRCLRLPSPTRSGCRLRAASVG